MHTSGVVGQTNRETEARQLMGVGSSGDDVADDLGVDDLARDIGVALLMRVRPS